MLLCVWAGARDEDVPGIARVTWDAMLDALDAVSPLVDEEREGLAYLDMRGIDGDARCWRERVHAALDPFELTVRVGIADTKFTAKAASFIGDGTVCDAADAPRLLAPLPAALLELDDRTGKRLELLGVRTLGDLARLPHGAFVRRFGVRSRHWHDCARGLDRTPFLPRAHALIIDAAIFGEGSAHSELQVFLAVRHLLERIGRDLERLGKSTGLLRLWIELENGDTRAIDVTLARPTADVRTIFDVARARLEGERFDAPITGLRARAIRLEAAGESQGLFNANDPDPRAVAVTLARLEAVLGEPACRARTVRAHPLEERFAYEPFEAAGEARTSASAAAQAVPQLRLLTVREIAVRVRDGMPAVIDLSSASRCAVIECAGPWRIEEGWFATPIARDEYDVLLDDGALYRIYRQGDRWYVRGAYD